MGLEEQRDGEKTLILLLVTSSFISLLKINIDTFSILKKKECEHDHASPFKKNLLNFHFFLNLLFHFSHLFHYETSEKNL